MKVDQRKMSIMKTSKPRSWWLLGLAFVLLLAPCPVRGDEASTSGPVPESVCKKLQALFQKHYPAATFTNSQADGVRLEYRVTTFEFPPADPTLKHENPIQRGPQKGGILCSVHLEKGNYAGQLFLFPQRDGQHGAYLIDRKVYKQLLLAPYSHKRDSHLWVSLSYPPDASEDFLKEFRALMSDFEKGLD
jgi:hypothetical protein